MTKVETITLRLHRKFNHSFSFVSSCSTSADGPSGFGFELTFRLRREPGEKSPPTWPAHLLQSLARYVFRSQAQLLPGDHIPWHCPLDQLPSSTSTSNNGTPGGCPAQPIKNSSAAAVSLQQQQQQQSVAMAAVAAAASLIAAQASNQGGEPIDPATYSSALAAAVSAAQAEYTKRTQSKQQQQQKIASQVEVSRIRHMLLVDDPQLAKISTPYGWVRFLQVRIIKSFVWIDNCINFTGGITVGQVMSSGKLRSYWGERKLEF